MLERVILIEYRFNVFGTPIAVRPAGEGWRTFYLGADGTSRPADFIVPSDIPAAALATYLADLFHEHATGRRPHVVRIAWWRV